MKFLVTINGELDALDLNDALAQIAAHFAALAAGVELSQTVFLAGSQLSVKAAP